MKRKFTFILICLSFNLLCFAQDGAFGHLTIFSENGDRFYLFLNGEQQNDIAQTNLRIEDLNQPYYNAKIIFEDKTLQEVAKNYLMIVEGEAQFRDVTYKVKRDKNNKSKMKLNFFSAIPVRQNYIAPSNVHVIHYGRPAVVSQTTTTTTSAGGVGVGVNVYGVNMNVNIVDPHGTTVTQTTTTQSSGQVYEDYELSQNHHNTPREQGCNRRYAMLTGNFNSALATVKNQGFDETRLKTAKQIVSANCVSPDQIVQIANVFGFEETKLDFAKFAYDFCTERGNYFKVNNIFSFSSSSEELSEYVQSRN